MITLGRIDRKKCRRTAWCSRPLLSGCLSVQENDPGDHNTLGFQRIILRGIDDYLLSLGQQIQHNVVIIFIVLECLGEIPYSVAIPAMKWGLSGLPIPFVSSRPHKHLRFNNMVCMDVNFFYKSLHEPSPPGSLCQYINHQHSGLSRDNTFSQLFSHSFFVIPRGQTHSLPYRTSQIHLHTQPFRGGVYYRP